MLGISARRDLQSVGHLQHVMGRFSMLPSPQNASGHIARYYAQGFFQISLCRRRKSF
jgi:hypothetical protein